MEPSPFVGLSVGFIFSLGAVLVGLAIVWRLVPNLPAGARWGICGGVGFGATGIAIFLLGPVAQYVAAAAVIFSLRHLALLKPAFPATSTSRIILLVLVFMLLLRLPSALSPSDAADWDSVSHQMAMAKIWNQHGKVDYIPFMHQSNIAPTVNMLYMYVLPFGGQFAAKTVAFFFAAFAVLTLGGLAQWRFGKNAGYWAGLAFLATPVVLWEVGTAYVDVAHGLFSGGAILFASLWAVGSDRRFLWLAGIFLGLALATKYTGFQIAFAIGLVLIGHGIARRSFGRSLKGFAAIGAVAIVICSPWYIRNVVNTGNPVYPFFYSVFEGSNWSQPNAETYAAEQRSFGIGQSEAGKSPLAIPGSVTALALQPDKQINQGTPWGAIGPIFLLGLLWWPLSGFRRNDRGPLDAEKLILLTILLSLLTWFYLTQQSRYIISLAFPAAFLLAGAAERARLGWLPAVAVGMQCVWTTYLFGPSVSPLRDQIAFIASGDFDEFLTPRLGFWQAATYLNDLGKSERVSVALYDEVHGYYLDVPYFWANPGHSRMIEYEKLQEPEDLIAQLKGLGTTHVYINTAYLGAQGKELREAFYPEMIKRSRSTGTANLEQFRRLLVQAYRQGLLEIVAAFGSTTGGLPPVSMLLKIKT
ncbi:MAG: ArnT family glycosyltransferase [Fimbriimonadales bacterium]